MRNFEHQGSISIAKRNADICIPDLDYAVSIEQGTFKVYGDVSEKQLYLNRKKWADATDQRECILHAGDRIGIDQVLIVYFEDHIEMDFPIIQGLPV